MQHSSILGFLTPVVAPLFAWVLLGQGITLATAVGGCLIVTAGVLVVVLGRAEARAGAAVTGAATRSQGTRRRAAPRRRRLHHRRHLVPGDGRQRAAGRVGRRAGGDHPLPAHGVRGAGARRRLPAAPDARRLAPPGRRLAPHPHGGDVVAHAAAVLLRRAPHQRRHRHVPPVPHAGVGGARGAAALQVAARADRVAGARPRPRRPDGHPPPRPPRGGRQALGWPVCWRRCSPGSATRRTRCP